MTETSKIDGALAQLPPDVLRLAQVVRRFAAAQDIALREEIKWGQPSFAPPKKSGTPVRLGQSAGKATFYVHCGSPVIERFLSVMPNAKVEGQRAFLPASLDDPAIDMFLAIAFGYRYMN